MNKMLLSVLILMLTGCGWLPVKTEIHRVPEQIQIIHPQLPNQLELEPVTFQVWNRERLREQAANAPEDIVLFVLDERNVKNLGSNLNSITLIMAEYRNLVDYYRNYLVDYNQRVQERVDQLNSR
jgi:hypothetical protein